MNRVNLKKRKFSLVTVLFRGFIILGIGGISWSLCSIWVQSSYALPPRYPSANVSIKSDSVPVLTAVPDKPLYTIKPTAEKKVENLEVPVLEKKLPNSQKLVYPANIAKGKIFGSLTIPALQQNPIPIIEGTRDDDLKKGVGHFIQSVFPGENDNCVLSGHRDTVFSKLGKLKIGDQFIVQTSAGTFTYEIKRKRIVDKDDKTVIVPTDHAVLTVTTCYPFNFIGSAPDRYVLVADLVMHKK